MAQKNKAVIVDTYAIMADLTGQITLTAMKTLDKVRVGEIKGIIHYLVIYELAYHYMKKRLPFRDIDELREFIDTYFYVDYLDPLTAIEAARIKIVGDNILRNTSEEYLSKRRLSTADATTIALALKYRVPIVTCDRDLAYVAEKMGVNIIW